MNHALYAATVACNGIARTPGHRRREFAVFVRWMGIPDHAKVLWMFPRGSKWRRAVVRCMKNKERKENQ